MMETLEYFKIKKRMTKSCSIKCDECTLNYKKTDKYSTCFAYECNSPEKAIEIVENWAKENPVKTYKDVFLEKFPKAKVNSIGNTTYIPTCVKNVFGVNCKCSCAYCKDCWNQPYEEYNNV